ncbi:MAG: TetR/AcrR family transcriptional regulator [Dethiobacteria bacterium]|nr:TetR/AcrR family transcriptional regulator [Bacillota bacterium]HPZ41015.1 TetR/AcrR family transcriptional regulator [Bacillota bacterium]HQD52105.1 TetR/AcrR family transcriptional regulator [Bacillota bacterium]
MRKKSTLMMLKENERETRKRLIIESAISLFAKKSFDTVSMRDIARAAGISPASIYRYFNDKDDLFVEAFSYKAEEIIENLEKIIDENTGLPLEDIAVNFVNYLFEHESFFQMMTHFITSGTIKESSLARFNEIERSLLDLFDKSFKKMGATQNVRLLSHAFFASLNGIMITFVRYPGRSKEEVKKHINRLATLLADVFKRGI